MRRLPFSPWHLLLMPLALIFVLPLVQMVLTSFMSNAEINKFPPQLIPTALHLEGYRTVLTETKILRWFGNTVLVSAISVGAHLVLCSLAGYGFARLKFAGRGLAFVFILATVMIPIQLLMIPTYMMFTRIGIVDTLAAAFVPWLASAFGIFLMRQFFLGIPRDLKEAAILDGASPFAVFWQIFLPLSKPALTALGIVSFVTSWNDLLAPMIFITTFEKMPIALALSFFKGQGEALWPWVMAASMISMLPLMVVYLAAQRWFIEGLTFTGLKQ
jgi:multiple sugar transport system permease protein